MSENHEKLKVARLMSAVNTARVVADHKYRTEYSRQGLPPTSIIQFTFAGQRFEIDMPPMIRLTDGSTIGFVNGRCTLVDNDARKKVTFTADEQDYVTWTVDE
jgi:hypothetical protein